MSERLTKYEWEKKIAGYHADIIGTAIPPEEFQLWWYRKNDIGLRLNRMGLERFQQAEIKFNKYEVHIPTWTGSLILGLNRMPAPFYIEPLAKYSVDYDFYISDEEYAMLLMFMDNNLILFAKGFLI